MNKLTVAAAVACAALWITGCDTEPAEDADEPTVTPLEETVNPSLDASTQAPDETAEAATGFLTVGDCMVIEDQGEGFSYIESVDCTEPHNAEVFSSATVSEGDTLGELEQACQDSLEPPYDNVENGEAHALPGDPDAFEEPGAISEGDDVYCVYVHSEAVQTSINQ